MSPRRELLTFDDAARVLDVGVDRLCSITADWVLTQPEAWTGVDFRSAWIGGAGLDMFRHELRVRDDMATQLQLAEARDWVLDCDFPDVDGPDELGELSDAELVDGVDRHYQGGWPAFIRGLLGLA